VPLGLPSSLQGLSQPSCRSIWSHLAAWGLYGAIGWLSVIIFGGSTKADFHPFTRHFHITSLFKSSYAKICRKIRPFLKMMEILVFRPFFIAENIQGQHLMDTAAGKQSFKTENIRKH
jgi:hypothetical protein